MVRSYVVALALLALVAGCSGDEEELIPNESGPNSFDERFDGEAVRADLEALWVGDDTSPKNLDAGRCFADALLGNNTPEAMRYAHILDRDYQVSPDLEGLRPRGARMWVDAQFACSDLVAESGRAQVAATKGKVDREAYETCLRRAVTEEQLREVAESSLLGDLSGDAVAAFSAAQLDCVREALPRE